MRPLRELATSPAGKSVAKPAAKAGGKALAGDTAQDEGMELWGTDSSWAGSLDCAGLLLGDSKAALQIPVRGGVVPPELVAFESVTVAVEVRAGCIKRSLITGVCRMHAQGCSVQLLSHRTLNHQHSLNNTVAAACRQCLLGRLAGMSACSQQCSLISFPCASMDKTLCKPQVPSLPQSEI